MRHWLKMILPLLLVAAPAAAQPKTPASDGAAAAGTAPQQAGDHGKTPVPAGKDSQKGEPPPQESKDESLTKYDVTGSSASDAMGGAPVP